MICFEWWWLLLGAVVLVPLVAVAHSWWLHFDLYGPWRRSRPDR